MTPEQQLIEGVLRGAVGHYNLVDLHALCRQAEEALAAYRQRADSLAASVELPEPRALPVLSSGIPGHALVYANKIAALLKE